MSAREVTGKAGTIYIELPDRNERQWRVWFEDFHIIGQGPSEIEALKDAEQMTMEMTELVRSAISSANPLTEEESQLVIGAIPLEAL